MKPIHLRHRLLSGLAATAALALALNACQSSGKPPMVPPVPPEKRIVLQTGGPHQGQYDTGDLTVGYSYMLKPDVTGDIFISGQVQGVRFKYRTVSAYVDFLDDTGAVLQRKIVYTSGSRSTDIPKTNQFETSLSLPPGTTGMTFSSRLAADRGHR